MNRMHASSGERSCPKGLRRQEAGRGPCPMLHGEERCLQRSPKAEQQRQSEGELGVGWLRLPEMVVILLLEVGWGWLWEYLVRRWSSCQTLAEDL